MTRHDEIKARCEAGRPIWRVDVKWLLADNEAKDKLIAALTARAEKAEAENRWISVSERLPEKPPDYFKDGHWWMVSGEDFIVADSDGKVYEAHWTYGCSHQNYFWYVNSLTPLTNITHWQPLPQPPQKGE